MPDSGVSWGEIFALMTAVTWATGVVLFKKSGETVHPIGLNLFKNVLAVVLLIPTIYLFGETVFYPAPWRHYLIVFLSGAIGIGVADTLFFKSLNAIGAARSAIVDCLYSPSVIGLSMIFLGERLSVVQIVGVTLIISAVLTAVSERKMEPADRKTILWGVFYGALAMGFTATGIVIVKPILNESPLLWVTEMRLLSGVAVLALFLLLMPSRRAIIRSVYSRIGLGYTFWGSFSGGYLAMALWIAGMKFTQASTAAALNQTSNIFIFIFAAVFLRERITLFRLIGILLGVGGALLVTFG
ncbi:EamA family transporter [candidate division GN15 bacterium]|nr:EamA family transporter [candidate division GN15 bacterium]